MKNILVTLGTSAIGKSVAECLATENKVTLTGRNQGKLDVIIKNLNSDNIQGASLDFFDTQSIDNCLDSIETKLDGVVFIIPRIQATTEIFPADEQWQLLFDQYFIKPLRLLKGLHDRDLLADGAKIVCISGLSSKQALMNYAMNNCLRSAWLGQTKSMALVLAKKKIVVNTLSLGGVLTESYVEKMEKKAVSQSLSYDDLMTNEVSNIPLGSYATPENVGDTVKGLLGSMTDHMTGQNFMLDGGFVRVY